MFEYLVELADLLINKLEATYNTVNTITLNNKKMNTSSDIGLGGIKFNKLDDELEKINPCPMVMVIGKTRHVLNHVPPSLLLQVLIMSFVL